MKKPAIPATDGVDPQLRKLLDPIKENIEVVTGRRGKRITPLPDVPTSAQIATKVNELLTLLQG